MDTTTLAAGTAHDLLMISAALPDDACADAFGEFVDLVQRVVTAPLPNQADLEALRFACDVFRGEH